MPSLSALEEEETRIIVINGSTVYDSFSSLGENQPKMSRVMESLLDLEIEETKSLRKSSCRVDKDNYSP